MRKRFLLLVTILTICLSLGLVLASCGGNGDSATDSNGESILNIMTDIRNVKMPTSDSEGMLEWLNENGEWVALALPKLTDGAYNVIERKEATCTDFGYMVFEIKGREKEGAWRVTLPRLEHKWGEVQYMNEDGTPNTEVHWVICSVCGKKMEYEHNGKWVIDKEATPDAPGKMHRDCACGYHEEKEIPIQHIHNYVEKHDDNFHWKECSCGAIIEKSTHVFPKDEEDPLLDKWIVDVEPTCTTVGKRHKECSCGYRVEEDIPVIAHAYEKDGATIGADGKPVKVPNWKYNDKFHWRVCTECGKVDPSFAKQAHDFNPMTHECICGALDPVYREENGFIIEKKTNKVVMYKDKSETILDIPAGVEIIAEGAFSDLANVTKVVIPTSVVTIERGAFENCTSLTDVVIPLDVATIGTGAFKGCTSLASINVEPAKDYPDWAVGWNSGKTVNYLYGTKSTADYTYVTRDNNAILLGYIGASNDVVVPATIEEQGNGGESVIYNVIYFGAIFRGNTAITSVTINAPLKFVQNMSFENCTSLTSVVWNEPALSVGHNVFSGCNAITSITIPYLGDRMDNPTNARLAYLFGGNVPKTLTSVTVLGKGNTTISDGAFAGVTSLASITLGEGVTTIGASAFKGCDHITEIALPKSVTAVGADAFSGCIRLSKVTILDVNAWLGIDFATKESNPIAIAHDVYMRSEAGDSEIVSLNIDSTITAIKDYAFTGASKITDIALPQTLVSIGKGAFSGMVALKSIDIPNGIQEISERAFSGCGAMTSVTLPDTVTAIGEGAFEGCKNLSNFALPANLETIGSAAFAGCSFGKTEVIELSIPASVTSIGASAFSNTDITSLVIDNKALTSIGAGAFDGMAKLNKLTISDIDKWSTTAFASETANPLYYAHTLYVNGVKTTELDIASGTTAISSYAFIGATGITKVTLPATVQKIGKFAFSDMTSLLSINIPEGITELEMSVFKGCSVLNNVIIPDSVLTIDGDVFNGCASLSNITLPSNLTIIGDGAFAASGVTSVVIPDSVTSIKDYAFKGCDKLTSITFGEGSTLDNIGQEAFANCTALSSIVIPKSCDKIAMNAFANTPNLIIYAKVTSKPANWVANWNPQSRPVYWYSLEEPTAEMKASGNKYWHNGASGIEIWH